MLFGLSVSQYTTIKWRKQPRRLGGIRQGTRESLCNPRGWLAATPIRQGGRPGSASTHSPDPSKVVRPEFRQFRLRLARWAAKGRRVFLGGLRQCGLKSVFT